MLRIRLYARIDRTREIVARNLESDRMVRTLVRVPILCCAFRRSLVTLDGRCLFVLSVSLTISLGTRRSRRLMLVLDVRRRRREKEGRMEIPKEWKRRKVPLIRRMNALVGLPFRRMIRRKKRNAPFAIIASFLMGNGLRLIGSPLGRRRLVVGVRRTIGIKDGPFTLSPVGRLRIGSWILRGRRRRITISYRHNTAPKPKDRCWNRTHDLGGSPHPVRGPSVGCGSLLPY